jgi:hypothetical protein
MLVDMLVDRSGTPWLVSGRRSLQPTPWPEIRLAFRRMRRLKAAPDSLLPFVRTSDHGIDCRRSDVDRGLDDRCRRVSHGNHRECGAL